MEEFPITTTPKPTDWWTRPCGGFDVLRQAVPLIISTGSISLMNFTDRMFLMWYHPDAMTASMQGGMLFWASVSIPSAIGMFVTTFVAQYYGSNNYSRIGSIVWQGIWLGIISMPILFLLAPFLGQLFVDFGHKPELVALEVEFFEYLLWGSAAVIGGESAAGFFRGRSKMQVEMYVNVLCVLLNVVLDYCWIFGKFGFPEWGLAGGAIATVVAQWFRFCLYIGLMFLADHEEKRFQILRGMKPDFKVLGRLLYYGMPSSSYTFVDVVSFTAFIMIIGGLGEIAASATTIAFTMNTFTFLPLIGTGIVVTSMVGNQLGDDRPDLAHRATITAVVIGTVYTAFFGILFLAIPGLLLSGFAAFTKVDDFLVVRDMSVVLLRFIAIYLFFDSCTILFSSALRGAGDTIYVMRVTLFMAPMLPIFCAVGIRVFGLGVFWCWTVLSLWVFVFSLFFTARFFSGKWKKMRVIETELQKHRPDDV